MEFMNIELEHYNHKVGLNFWHLEWVTKYRYIHILSVMPDHVHTLVTLPKGMNEEKGIPLKVVFYDLIQQNFYFSTFYIFLCFFNSFYYFFWNNILCIFKFCKTNTIITYTKFINFSFKIIIKSFINHS